MPIRRPDAAYAVRGLPAGKDLVDALNDQISVMELYIADLRNQIRISR